MQYSKRSSLVGGSKFKMATYPRWLSIQHGNTFKLNVMGCSVCVGGGGGGGGGGGSKGLYHYAPPPKNPKICQHISIYQNDILPFSSSINMMSYIQCESSSS